MIPENRDELHTAGEYVLGVLDTAEAGEIETAIVTNAALRDAVAFWEETLTRYWRSHFQPSRRPSCGIGSRRGSIAARQRAPRCGYGARRRRGAGRPLASPPSPPRSGFILR